jgi:hypothetical protein
MKIYFYGQSWIFRGQGTTGALALVSSVEIGEENV